MKRTLTVAFLAIIALVSFESKAQQATNKIGWTNVDYVMTVSYTHLDVYKRQKLSFLVVGVDTSVLWVHWGLCSTTSLPKTLQTSKHGNHFHRATGKSFLYVSKQVVVSFKHIRLVSQNRGWVVKNLSTLELT